MYAYTMQPKTIPREYYSWVVQHGRVPKVTIEYNRLNTIANQAGKVYATETNMNELMTKLKPTPENRQRFIEYYKSHNNSLPKLPWYLNLI
jgi:hypothetical protein